MDNNQKAHGSRSFIAIVLIAGTAIWALNPFPFFGLAPLQAFLPDQYYLRTINQLRQSGMLHPLSQVFIVIEIEAAALLALAIISYLKNNTKLAISYAVIIIVLSIIPWLRFFSELSQSH